MTQSFGTLASGVLVWTAHRALVEAGRFEEYFDANIRLRMGEDALARLKSRPERYAEVTGRLRRHSVASLLALLDETYARTDWLADCGRIRCAVQVIAGVLREAGLPISFVGTGQRVPEDLHRATPPAIAAWVLGDHHFEGAIA